MKYLLSCIFCFVLFSNAVAQETTEPKKEKDLDSLLDELFDSETELNELIAEMTNFKFLYVSMNYNSETYFSGRDIGIDQYNLRPQVTYVDSKGFFASVSGAYYSEFDPKLDLLTASLGYGKYFDKKKLFKWNTSYTRYFYFNDLENLFDNTVGLGLSYRTKKRNFGVNLSGAFLFGQEQSFQVSSSIFTRIKLYKSKKHDLVLRPDISFVLAQQTIELVDTEISNEVFDLINTQFSIPLQYTINSFDFELGYTFNFPNALENDEDLHTTGFFNFSVAYLISL
ncbi:hypothetical protein [Flavicella sediminum]|uniref:hypothetical protein n=1 Tax=Flavicella sediminum TaxID=2585141 RepID=UPI001123D184|nr:hypothetical protein [Flavicella sediminum]